MEGGERERETLVNHWLPRVLISQLKLGGSSCRIGDRGILVLWYGLSPSVVYCLYVYTPQKLCMEVGHLGGNTCTVCTHKLLAPGTSKEKDVTRCRAIGIS